MTDQQKPQASIFLGNLAYEATEAEVQSELEFSGIQVQSVRIARDHDTQRSRGFGFLTLPPSEDPTKVISIINQVAIEIRGRRIRADLANQREARPARPQGGRGRQRHEFRGRRGEFEDT